MIVADASLVVDLLVDGGPRGSWAAGQLAPAASVHAPHVLDLEVLSALRRRALRGELAPERARIAVADLAELPIERYPVTHLLDRIWMLRDRFTPYDAAYLSLAEALAAPVVTTDGRLARAGGHHAEIRAFGG